FGRTVPAGVPRRIRGLRTVQPARISRVSAQRADDNMINLAGASFLRCSLRPFLPRQRDGRSPGQFIAASNLNLITNDNQFTNLSRLSSRPRPNGAGRGKRPMQPEILGSPTNDDWADAFSPISELPAAG